MIFAVVNGLFIAHKVVSTIVLSVNEFLIKHRTIQVQMYNNSLLIVVNEV